MPRCSYCEREGFMTREHVIPAFIYALGKKDGGVTGWNLSAEKMMGGELKVKDVCADCNNGVLSDLDAYAQSVLTRAGLTADQFEPSEVVLRYDFDRLLRWVMKVSFNSSRQADQQQELLTPYRGFILGKAPRPKRNEVRLAAVLLAPHPIPDKARSVAEEHPVIPKTGVWRPFLFRLAWAPEFGASSPMRVRVIVVGAVSFHLCLFAPGTTPGTASVQFRKLLSGVHRLKEVEPQLKTVVAVQSSLTWLNYYAPQIALQHAIGEA
jgi:hypothetical protein